ncbi:MAG: hypothetical protein DMG63_00015, partial [Acidobacteria bacterium]
MKRLLLKLALLLSVAFFAVCSAALQKSAAGTQKGSASSAASPQSSANVATKPGSSTPNQELTHASNEAAGRTPQEAEPGRQEGEGESHDQEAAFKYSAAVRAIARITGLSLVTAYWLCVMINFAIIAAFVIFVMRSNLPTMLRSRTQSIQKGMEDARRASEDAGRRLREVEARLVRMSSEIEEMQKRAEDEARSEEDRIRTSIDEEKHKILQAAEQEITQTTNAVRRDLQKYAAELAVSIDEKGIRIDTSSD